MPISYEVRVCSGRRELGISDESYVGVMGVAKLGQIGRRYLFLSCIPLFSFRDNPHRREKCTVSRVLRKKTIPFQAVLSSRKKLISKRQAGVVDTINADRRREHLGCLVAGTWSSGDE